MKKPSVWRVKIYKSKIGHTTLYVAAHSTKEVVDLVDKTYPGHSISAITDDGSVELFNIEHIPEFSHYRVGIRESKPYTLSYHVGVLTENIEAAIKLVRDHKPNAEILSVNHCGKVNFVIDLPLVETDLKTPILVASEDRITHLI